MTITELVAILQNRLELHGDLEVVIDPCDGSGDMCCIDEIDTACDHDGLVIWVKR